MPLVLTFLNGPQVGERAVFDQPTIRLGRATDNDLVFDSREVRASAHHAIIESNGDAHYISDLESTNGTYLGNKRVKRSPLVSGRILEFGLKGPRLLFELKSQEQLERSSAEETQPASGQGTVSSSGESAPRFGRKTVQFIINAAIRRSAIRLRGWMLLTSILALMAAAVALYIAQGRRGSTADAPSVFSGKEFMEIVAKNQKAVVLIQVQFDLLDERGRVLEEGSSEGSGFAADPEGHIITNYHIVRPWAFDPPELARSHGKPEVRSIKVIFADQRSEEAASAELVAEDAQRDLAILSIPTRAGLPTVLGFDPDLSHLRQGQEVAFLGFPLGTDLLNTTHQDRATTTLIKTALSKVSPNILQIDAPVYQGFSGSPIINSQGSVIGVLTARLGVIGEPSDTAARTIGVATPIGYALELLRRVSDTH